MIRLFYLVMRLGHLQDFLSCAKCVAIVIGRTADSRRPWALKIEATPVRVAVSVSWPRLPIRARSSRLPVLESAEKVQIGLNLPEETAEKRRSMLASRWPEVGSGVTVAL